MNKRSLCLAYGGCMIAGVLLLLNTKVAQKSLSQYFQYVDLYIQHPVSIGVVSATALRLDSGAHACQGNAPTYLLVLIRYEWKWDKLVLRTATLNTHRIARAQPHVGKAESIALVYKNI